MNVYEETSNSMKVKWVEVDGATGYVLQYRSINASEPQLQMEVRFFCRLIGQRSQLRARTFLLNVVVLHRV